MGTYPSTPILPTDLVRVLRHLQRYPTLDQLHRSSYGPLFDDQLVPFCAGGAGLSVEGPSDEARQRRAADHQQVSVLQEPPSSTLYNVQ